VGDGCVFEKSIKIKKYTKIDELEEGMRHEKYTRNSKNQKNNGKMTKFDEIGRPRESPIYTIPSWG
jgi:hypothetical protein